ncbi:MAG: sensor histidine kinase [Nocardioidaceae bacterium]
MDKPAPAGRRAAALIAGPHAVRAAQLAFVFPVLALELLLAATSPVEMVGMASLTGLGVALLATLAAISVPWGRLPAWAVSAVPFADVVALSAFHLVPSASIAGALVVIPAMWLGALHRSPGALLVTTASMAAFTVPSLLAAGGDLEGLSRAVVLPMVACVTAACMAAVAEMWTAQNESLAEQGARLEQALEEFRTHRAMHEAIIDTVGVGLLALGPGGEYRSMNPQQQQFLRVAFPDGHQGVAGQPGAVRAADNISEIAYDDMPSVRAMRGETFSDHNIWIGTDPARSLVLSVSARPLPGPDGNPDGAVLAYHDVTDLMRALRVKDDFVASVSHELRTPLTSIMGYLDLAREHPELPTEVAHYLSVAGRNADRLSLLVSDLLAVAQVEGAAMRLLPAPTDLGAVVHRCLDDVTSRAIAAGVTVTETIGPLPRVVADAGRIAQVVDNLLSNAVKYTPPGGRVRVVLQRDGADVLLEVSDTGIGLSADDREGLFTKFFRARNATERAIPGIGLGLAISKAIIDAHGGRIEVDSEEGAGTTVRVALPFVPTEPAPPLEDRLDSVG